MVTETNKSDSIVLPITIQAQYIKDLSFENPTPLASFKNESNVQPTMTVGIEANAQNLGGRNFEVVLDIRIKANREKTTLFIAELSYAGTLTLGDGVSEAEAVPLLMIEGPRLLFPFARSTLAEVAHHGGFPPIMLAPVDFVALYNQRQEKEPQKQISHKSKNIKKEKKISKAAKIVSLLNGVKDPKNKRRQLDAN